MWRQGDLLIETVETIPTTAQPEQGRVLASGDSTGQRHRLKSRKNARLYRLGWGQAAVFFVEVTDGEAEVVHPEHGTIALPCGKYRVWRQREWTDFGAQRMAD